MNNFKLDGVREYSEGYPVCLARNHKSDRLCIVADNQAGYDSTWVDLLDLIAWVKANRPELLK